MWNNSVLAVIVVIIISIYKHMTLSFIPITQFSSCVPWTYQYSLGCGELIGADQLITHIET